MRAAMNDKALATLLARSPALDPLDDALNLGATLKPHLRLVPSETPRDARNAEPEATPAPDPTLYSPRGTKGLADPRPSSTMPRAGGPDKPIATPAGYDILGELGRGGMGIVYRARQLTLRREVAVKRLQSDQDAMMRRAFLTESMVTGELEHPNIVPVYALCEEEEGGLWLVMKRIGGRTLAELIAEAPMPRDTKSIDRLLDVLLGVADALRFPP